MTYDKRPLFGLLAANAISITGNVLTVLAIPWFVLQTTGSATRTGIAAGASTLPIIFSGVFSGTVADRVGHRLTSIGSDLVSAGIVGLVPLLHATVGIEYWQLLVLVFLRSFFATPGETARGALMPDLAELSGTSLERATSGYDAVSRAARMVGAPLGGVLIALMGAPNLLILDAATFLLSALVVTRFVPGRPREPRERTPYFADLRAGMTYVRRDVLVRNVVILCMLTNMLDAGFGAVFLPIYSERVLESSLAFGIIAGVGGGGSVLGALMYGAWGERLPRRQTFVVAYVLCGIPRFAVLAMGAPLAVIVAVQAVSGFAAGSLNPIMDTSMYERLPVDMRARVYGVVFAGCTAAMPIGAVAAGSLVGPVGLTTALWVFGVAYLLVTLWPISRRHWSGLDRTPIAIDPYATVPA